MLHQPGNKEVAGQFHAQFWHLGSYWRIDCPGKIMNPRKTVILFFGRGGIFQNSQENYQKTHIVIFWGNFCMSWKKSRMIIHNIIQYDYTSITCVKQLTRLPCNRHLSTLQANFVNEHPCLLTIHCKTVHGEQAPETDGPHGLFQWKLMAGLSTREPGTNSSERNFRKWLVDSDDHFPNWEVIGLFSGFFAV